MHAHTRESTYEIIFSLYEKKMSHRINALTWMVNVDIANLYAMPVTSRYKSRLQHIFSYVRNHFPTLMLHDYQEIP